MEFGIFFRVAQKVIVCLLHVTALLQTEDSNRSCRQEKGRKLFVWMFSCLIFSNRSSRFQKSFSCFLSTSDGLNDEWCDERHDATKREGFLFLSKENCLTFYIVDKERERERNEQMQLIAIRDMSPHTSHPYGKKDGRWMRQKTEWKGQSEWNERVGEKDMSRDMTKRPHEGSGTMTPRRWGCLSCELPSLHLEGEVKHLFSSREKKRENFPNHAVCVRARIYICFPWWLAIRQINHATRLTFKSPTEVLHLGLQLARSLAFIKTTPDERCHFK